MAVIVDNVRLQKLLFDEQHIVGNTVSLRGIRIDIMNECQRKNRIYGWDDADHRCALELKKPSAKDCASLYRRVVRYK